MDRRIDPTRPLRPDGSPGDNDRVEIGPTALAFAEWQAAGLAPPDLAALRRGRLDRLVAGVVARDLGGLLLFDPLNIRYATDSTNMQVWTRTTRSARASVPPDGPVVLFDYAKQRPSRGTRCAPSPSSGPARPSTIFAAGAATEDAPRFAGEIAELMRVHGGGNRRLAVDDSISPAPAPCGPASSRSRTASRSPSMRAAIKSPEEIALCARALAPARRRWRRCAKRLEPGITENDIWAKLHATNIRLGGEWIETRLLSSGPRTNPWFHECVHAR